MKGTVPPPLLLPAGLSKTGAAGHPPGGPQGRGSRGEDAQRPGTWSYQRPLQHRVFTENCYRHDKEPFST